MMTSLLRRRFSVDDYARMREAGILTEDDRVELIGGEIYHMSPRGSLHIALVNRLNRLLLHLVGTDAIISVQNIIRLNDYSEPQPDIAVLRPDDQDYAAALPSAQDTFLVIEVADTSLAYDRDVKLPKYAESGIREVWIVDAQQSLIEQYTQPVHDQYMRTQKYLRGMAIQSVVLPQILFNTEQIFK